jgi:hypothetical protein
MAPDLTPALSGGKRGGHHGVVLFRFILACAVAIAASLLGGGATGFAQERPAPAPERHGRMGYNGSYLLVGPALAFTAGRSAGDGAALGGEASVVGVRDAVWAGAYLDATYAFAAEETRLSVGPEIGIRFLGIDGGYVLVVGGERGAQHGVAIRPMLTVGVVSVCFRSTWLIGEHADWLGELNVLVKVPIVLGNEAWFP